MTTQWSAHIHQPRPAESSRNLSHACRRAPPTTLGVLGRADHLDTESPRRIRRSSGGPAINCTLEADTRTDSKLSLQGIIRVLGNRRRAGSSSAWAGRFGLGLNWFRFGQTGSAFGWSLFVFGLGRFALGLRRFRLGLGRFGLGLSLFALGSAFSTLGSAFRPSAGRLLVGERQTGATNNNAAKTARPWPKPRHRVCSDMSFPKPRSQVYISAVNPISQGQPPPGRSAISPLREKHDVSDSDWFPSRMQLILHLVFKARLR